MKIRQAWCIVVGNESICKRRDIASLVIRDNRDNQLSRITIITTITRKMKNTIKSHKNFDFRENDGVVSSSFFIKWRPMKFEKPEYGLVVTKKNFPAAHDRNYAKRRLREWIRANKLPDDRDVIFIARKSILETDHDFGIKQVKRALKEIYNPNSAKKMKV